MEWVQWAAVFLISVQLYLMSEKQYRLGWWACLVACVAWTIYAVEIQSTGLLAQQAILAFLAIRGIWKLDRP